MLSRSWRSPCSRGRPPRGFAGASSDGCSSLMQRPANVDRAATSLRPVHKRVEVAPVEQDAPKVAAASERQPHGLDGAGGDPSRAQLTIIEAASRSWLMLSSVDDWLQRQPSIVNAKKRSLLPVVMQRQTLADSLLRHLTALGLERHARAVRDVRQLAGLPD